MTKIAISTCHICIEELEYNPNKIQKKCCPTKAFICNECWDQLKENEIKVCPLCKYPLIIETEQNRTSSGCSIPKQFYINLFKVLFIEIVGFIIINLIIYFAHSRSTTFKREIEYLYPKIQFWIMCFMMGLLIYSILKGCNKFDSNN